MLTAAGKVLGRTSARGPLLPAPIEKRIFYALYLIAGPLLERLCQVNPLLLWGPHRRDRSRPTATGVLFCDQCMGHMSLAKVCVETKVHYL